MYMQSVMSCCPEVGLVLDAKNRVWVMKIEKTFRARGKKREKENDLAKVE